MHITTIIRTVRYPFNKEPLETDEYLSILATETLAIRLGDDK